MNPCGRITPHAEHTFTMDSTDRDGVRTVTTYYCTGNPAVSAVELSRATIAPYGDLDLGVVQPADHLLHFTPAGDRSIIGGGEWRLECVHAPDDPRWVIVDGEPMERCWTIDWFDNDGYDTLRGEWPEDPTFPLPVDCVWADGDYLEVRPWKPEATR